MIWRGWETYWDIHLCQQPGFTYVKVGKNAGGSWNGCGWCSINEEIQRKNGYVVSRLKEIPFYGVNCSIVCAKIQFMTAKTKTGDRKKASVLFLLPFLP